MKRHDWKGVHRFLKKASFSEFKNFLTNLGKETELEAYSKAVSQGKEHIKQDLEHEIQKILKEEFQIGPKRFERFKTRFEEAMNDTEFHMQCSLGKDLPEDRCITLHEQTSLVILLCMKEYIEETIRISDKNLDLFKEHHVLESLFRVKTDLEKLLEVAKTKSNEEHFSQAEKKASEKKLMLQNLDWENPDGTYIKKDINELYDLFEQFFKKSCGEKCTESDAEKCPLRVHLIKNNIPVLDPTKSSGCEYK